MFELEGPDATDWAERSGRALRALRLNKHFPPWRPVADTLEALALSGSVRIDASTGLPAPREWVRARADRDMAKTVLQEFADLDPATLPPAEGERLRRKRASLTALLATPPVHTRNVAVALRHRAGDRASYRIVVDRADVATGTLARYTMLASDTPGSRVSEGELSLRASAAFAGRLELLSTQDAALAFALLRERGLEVEEIVRGVIGPAGLPGRAGPEVLRGLEGVAWTACLERVSLDLSRGRVDDPLKSSVVVPAANVDFGLVVQRKWAVARSDKPVLRRWLERVGSRNLVYDYATD